MFVIGVIKTFYFRLMTWRLFCALVTREKIVDASPLYYTIQCGSRQWLTAHVTLQKKAMKTKSKPDKSKSKLIDVGL